MTGPAAMLSNLPATPRMPALFVGHGNPMNAIVDNDFSRGWRQLGESLPVSHAILCASAHWMTRGRIVCRRWKEWVAAQVNKYDWDTDPDHPTIHGLRGTGILARAEQGYEVDQIANDIGMSRQNVEHYKRFRDQLKVGADGQKRLRLVTRED